MSRLKRHVPARSYNLYRTPRRYTLSRCIGNYAFSLVYRSLVFCYYMFRLSALLSIIRVTQLITLYPSDKSDYDVAHGIPIKKKKKKKFYAQYLRSGIGVLLAGYGFLADPLNERAERRRARPREITHLPRRSGSRDDRTADLEIKDAAYRSERVLEVALRITYVMFEREREREKTRPQSYTYMYV